MKGNFVPDVDEKIRWDCYRAGMIDRVAAEKCFISKDSFQGWRTRRNLPVISGGRWGK